MADDARIDDVETVDTRNETEPATRHDVAEGGILGAVGGAIVGGLAGGPLGAVIGAVVGGVASAGAVDLVDKHDHDYADMSPGDAAHEAGDAAPLPSTGDATSLASVETPEAIPSDLSVQIRERAYEIYERRGCGDGLEVEDWLEAEREIIHA